MAQGCFNYIFLITFQSLAPKKIKILLLRSSSFSPCEIDGQRSQSGAAPQKFTNYKGSSCSRAAPEELQSKEKLIFVMKTENLH